VRRGSLASRLLLVTMAGGVVVAAVAYLLSVTVVQDVARDQVRQQLGRSVDAFASQPQLAMRMRRQEQMIVGPGERGYSIVLPDGRVQGPAAELLTRRQIRTLIDTGTLSATKTVDGEDILIEGRTTSRQIAGVATQPAGGVDEATAALTKRLLIALLIGLAAAGTLGLLISRRLAHSVAQAAGAARRLAAGERGVTVAESSVSEIADMSRAIGALDQALIASEGRQREFLLSVSHEIRTPLTALRGYAEALADGAIAPDDIASTGRTLVAETARLDRFVSDLLALARLEADDFSIAPARLEVAELLQELATAWQATCEREAIGLRVESSRFDVQADPMRLRQLLDGLVENAVRATPAGAEVVVRARESSGSVVIEVADAGPGFTDDDLAETFERGALHARYRDVRAVGTGLGLSIAHRLATRMGVDLRARRGDDGGAVLAVSLPAAGRASGDQHRPSRRT
jgi:two-component system OmpR family sensor kinase